MKSIVIAAAFGLLAACAHADSENHRLVPTDAQLRCDTDDDCTLANLACSSCGDVVAKAFAETLQAEVARRCAGYTGPDVLCAPPRAVVCSAHRCASSASRPREKE